LLKAYCGFKGSENIKSVVTGNWGCGAFCGDVRVKFLIQWVSASLAKKQLIYCPFGSR
jgi:poly(ADP-ribose) glycohydrolase